MTSDASKASFKKKTTSIHKWGKMKMKIERAAKIATTAVIMTCMPRSRCVHLQCRKMMFAVEVFIARVHLTWCAPFDRGEDCLGWVFDRLDDMNRFTSQLTSRFFAE